MTRVSRTIDTQLAHAEVALNNALAEGDLQTALARYGYDTQRIEQGLALLTNAVQQQQRQKTFYGDLSVAQAIRDALQQQAEIDYIRYVKVARVVFAGDHGALKKLDLTGPRKSSGAGWLSQVRHFYGIALADPVLLAKLGEFGISQAKLEAGKQQIEAVAENSAAKQRFKGNARDATMRRDASMKALETWMRAFRTVARVALHDRPQLLEELAVTVRA